MSVFLCVLIPLIVSLSLIELIIKIAQSGGICIDIPNVRKMHMDPTPRIGGVGIALGVFLVVPFLTLNHTLASYLAGSIVVFLVGLIDDFKGLRWKGKMVGTIVAALLFVYISGFRINSLGNLFGTGEIELGLLSLPFTVFCILGVVNAINMIDGLNGLAAGISIISLVLLGTVANMGGDASLMLLCFIVASATMGFLIHNYPKGRIFLGDSGSLFLGFSIAVIAISLFQPQTTHYEPMAAVLIIAVPVYDTLRVMCKRILQGKNPFHADKTHLHHLFLRCLGIPHNSVAPLLWVINAIGGLIALRFIETEGWFLLLVLFSVYLVLTVLLNMMISLKFNRRIIKDSQVMKHFISKNVE